MTITVFVSVCDGTKTLGLVHERQKHLTTELYYTHFVCVWGGGVLKAGSPGWSQIQYVADADLGIVILHIYLPKSRVTGTHHHVQLLTFF